MENREVGYQKRKRMDKEHDNMRIKSRIILKKQIHVIECSGKS
jgi:hypothetical protein